MTFPEKPFTSDLSIVKNGITYALPAGWKITDAGAYTFNNSLQDKTIAHGSDCIGDGKVSGRTVTVEYDLVGATEEAHDAIVNEAYRYFAQSDYALVCGRTDRQYNVAGISKIKHEFEKGFKQRWSTITVSLLLADPFRYACTPTVVSSTYTAAQSAAEITFSNPSSIDVPLIFEFTPTVSMPAITVEHVESGQSFTVQDTLLTNPATLTVNGNAGTVRRDTNNAINAFSGLFLRALPGSNTFKFTGDAGTVELIYTAGWFV